MNIYSRQKMRADSLADLVNMVFAVHAHEDFFAERLAKERPPGA